MLVSMAFAQTKDAEGCNDHPLFKRMVDFYIIECSESIHEYKFAMGHDKTQIMEGPVTKIIYKYDEAFGRNILTKMELIENYEKEMNELGGATVHHKKGVDDDWTGATFHLKKDGVEYWVGIYDLVDNPVDQYTFVILSKGSKTIDIMSEGMYGMIESGDILKLYIDFEAEGAAIKEKSHVIIDNLHEMLHHHPSLRIVIEDYTDNVGDEIANQILSEKRVMTVKQALIDKGIVFDRIEAVGYGGTRPIGDNST